MFFSGTSLQYATTEYDLDELDQQWLRKLNASSRGGLSLPDFEFLIDAFEKQYFQRRQLFSGIRRYIGTPVDENESYCQVCRDPESYEDNQILFCDGCNVAVHMVCYGLTSLPVGSWLCDTCENSILRKECALCPNLGGALKATVDGRWVHVSCALWIPEIYFKDPESRSAVAGLSDICEERFKLVCSLCKLRKGACVQCCRGQCASSFHVTCAQDAGFQVVSKLSARGEISCKVFCKKHGKYSDSESRSGSSSPSPSDSELSVDFASNEFVPELVCPEDAVADRPISISHNVLESVYQYWLQKRRANNGEPLLVRFLRPHLGMGITTKESVNYEAVMNLRQNLETARSLAYLAIKREKLKKDVLQITKEIIAARLKDSKGLFYACLIWWNSSSNLARSNEIFPWAMVRHGISRGVV